MAILMAVLAAAAQPAPAVGEPAAPAVQTLQQAFDEASDDAASGNCSAAVQKFTALEQDRRLKPGSLAAAAIAVRKGTCAIRLSVPDIDEAAIQGGLASLAKAGSAFNSDVAAGWIALGDAGLDRYDYGRATAAYKTALSVLTGPARLEVLPRLAKSTAFDPGPEPLSYAEEGISLVSAMAKPDKAALAAFHTMHARTLLNRGSAADAYKELKLALSLNGGLTSDRVSLSDVGSRSDLAMAAALSGKKDEARLYLAYTGAGRIEKSPFKSAVSMAPPLCGTETGLRPDDVAVVEFGIDDDGTVADAKTVYSRGGSAVAAAFGRAVRDWYWKPADIAAIPRFYRTLVRVELRCSTVGGGGPGLMAPLRERYQAWATAQLPGTSASDAVDPGLRKVLHGFLQDGAAAPNPLPRIAALGWLAEAEPVPGQERRAMADEALRLSATTTVPQHVVNWLRIVRILATSGEKRSANGADMKTFGAVLEDADIAGDALAVDTFRIALARGKPEQQPRDAATLLAKVAEDDRLPARHPLRQLAWLELAGHAAAAGNRTDAQEYFNRTGLTEEQCALLGEAPALERSNAGGEDYPDEALKMGFEGWVQTEHDISTTGKTTNIRPLIAYPPLIFVDAATSMTKALQYAVSFRPEGATACTANRQTFNFILGR